MADREKVIKGLEMCLASIDEAECPEECPYYETCRNYENRVIFQPVMRDTLELLKEQEPIKPTLSVDTWICSKCGHTLESQELIDDKENPQVLVHEQYEYCPCCGRKVMWDG